MNIDTTASRGHIHSHRSSSHGNASIGGQSTSTSSTTMNPATGGNRAANPIHPNKAISAASCDDSRGGEEKNNEDDKAKKKRTKSGCLTCRRRKVKCGEERPTCRRCLSARVECAGYPPPSTTDKISNGNNNKNKRPNRQGGDTDSRRSSSTTGSSSSTSSTSSSANTSSTAESASDMARGRESPPLTGPVRKAARLTNNATNSESPSGYSTSPSGQEQSAPALYTSTGPRLSLDSTAGQSSMTYPRSSSRDSLNKRKSLSNVSTSSMSTSVSAPLYSARSFSNQSQSSLPSSRSNETIATAPTLSRVESTTSSSLPPVTTSSYTHTHTPSVGQYSSSSSSTFERDFNGYQRDIPIDNRYRFNETQQPSSSSSSLHHQQNHHHQHQPQQSAFSPTLAPPLQAQIQPSQIPFNGNTFAPFAFDSPFPIQPFASASPMIGASGTGQHSNASNNNNAIMQQANTPIDFDSLFGYSDKNIRQEENGPNSGEGAIGNGNRQEGGNVGAPFPVDYWEDADFVDRIMTGFRDVRANEGAQMMNAAGESLQPHLDMRVDASGPHQQFTHMSSTAPSLSSGKSSVVSPTARTPSISSPMYTLSNLDTRMSRSHSQTEAQSPRSTASDLRGKTRPPSSSSSSRHIRRLSNATSTVVPQSNAAPPSSTNTTMADFAPQPAIDPILQATSISELHKAAANRNKNAPSLKELEMGPPPNFHGNQKEWSIPPKMNETLKGMNNARHVELLKHYFINLVGLFSPIDHPKNPFRTFVAEHATESLSLLHAVLAVSAINQQPLSVEARAESLLYFEAAVDLYVRSLQQQDDISLFTLLFLSLYYAFDSGTAQPQHFSRRAQSIINERLDLLGYSVLQASTDFRFLVRLHVWYEVMANISRRPGDLRDMACGQYTLTNLIALIERWDSQEEKAAGLSGVNPDFIMNGCVGVPTFFISLLNDISLLKEEQHNILSVPQEGLNEQGQAMRKAIISKHTRKIRDLECKIQFARPGRLLLPPIVANELQLHRAVSVRFFDLFRLAASIHLLTELQGTPVNDPAIQLRTTEMVNLLGNIEQNSNYNTSGIWAFFIAGAAASNHMDRIALHRRLDSTWNSPCGNVWSLRSVLDEVWQRNAEALENNEPCQNWKDIAQHRGWLLLLM